MKNLELNKRELRMVDQVILVPLYATSSKQLIEKTGLSEDYLESLHQKTKSLLEKVDTKNDEDLVPLDGLLEDTSNLIKVYIEALPIAKNFDDIQTLTGFEEEEVDALQEKFKSIVS